MRNNTKFKPGDIIFPLLYNDLGFSFCSSLISPLIDKVSIFLLKISNKMCYQVLISNTIDDFINYTIYLRSSSKAMTDRGKIGEDGNTKT